MEIENVLLTQNKVPISTKNHIELFSNFLDERHESQMYNVLITTNCIVQVFSLSSQVTSIDPSIFLRRALWADGVSLPMSTVASRDQFKPIRIPQNLLLNYETQ